MQLLARLGRLAFRHRFVTLLLWLLAVIAGGLAAGPVFVDAETSEESASFESTQAVKLLEREGDRGGEVLCLVDGVDVAAPAIVEAVRRNAAAVAGMANVREVTHPYLGPEPIPALISKDGRALLVVVVLRNVDVEATDAAADAVVARLRLLDADLAEAGLPAARVRFSGPQLLERAVGDAIRDDLHHAEVATLPITLIVLVFIFGGLAAASLPVAAAVVAAIVSFVLLFGFSNFIDLDHNVVTICTMLGLALSIDYGLLLVSRYREERGAGYEPEVAVERAWATAGRTVAFSALTVAAALGGLVVLSEPILSGQGAAGISIALLCMATALTLTPALLALAGRRIRPASRGRHLAVAAAQGSESEVGLFADLARAVQRRPLVMAALAAAALLTAGVPLLTVTMKAPSLEGMPRSEAVDVANEVTVRFGRTDSSRVTVVARADTAGLDAWAARWRGDPSVLAVDPATEVASGLATVEIQVTGTGYDDAAVDFVERLRADRPPAESWVAGEAAYLADLYDSLRDELPLAIALTVTAMFVLLFLMTGSLVVPVKAIAMNVVSLSATFGVLVAVFEKGWLAGPLDAAVIGGLSPFTVVSVIAFSFALAMDYEVFLLARIKEYVDAGSDSETAVRRGLQRSGRIITAAALLMVIVFAGFAGARVNVLEQIGLGCLVSVVIDATIVRCVLVPATMTLMGRWNWWAPAPLVRLHRIIGLVERDPTGPEPGRAVPPPRHALPGRPAIAAVAAVPAVVAAAAAPADPAVAGYDPEEVRQLLVALGVLRAAGVGVPVSEVDNKRFALVPDGLDPDEVHALLRGVVTGDRSPDGDHVTAMLARSAQRATEPPQPPTPPVDAAVPALEAEVVAPAVVAPAVVAPAVVAPAVVAPAAEPVLAAATGADLVPALAQASTSPRPRADDDAGSAAAAWWARLRGQFADPQGIETAIVLGLAGGAFVGAIADEAGPATVTAVVTFAVVYGTRLAIGVVTAPAADAAPVAGGPAAGGPAVGAGSGGSGDRVREDAVAIAGRAAPAPSPDDTAGAMGRELVDPAGRLPREGVTASAHNAD